MANIEFLAISVSIFAVVLNLAGLFIALAANSKFQGGMNKQIVKLVLALVIVLNIHIILSVYNNTSLFFYGKQSSHVLLDQIGFTLVIIVTIFTIAASIMNLVMAKEQGFRT